MTREEYILLVEKIVDGSATDAEIALYNESFNTFQKDEETWEQIQLDPVVLEQKSWNQIYGNIQPIEKPVIKLWPRIAVAAAAVAAIVFGVYFFNANRHANTPRHPELVSGPQDIAPGKNGATITLANGNVIQLSDKKLGVVVGSELKYNDGAAVQDGGPDLRQDDVMQLTASTAKGQTYQFTLPDGTKVWLNTDSKISFPSQFIGKERKILLEGEGYFEVVHNAKQPFRVESKGQIVEDIGTEFNINAYADEAVVKTTLVEGEARVHLTGISDKPFRTLVPGQQSVLSGDGMIKIVKVNPEESVAWKDGVFMYNSTPLENVMRQIARWYNVEVEYADPGAKSRMLGGTALRSGNLSVILKTLESTGAVKFKVEGRKIIVK